MNTDVILGWFLGVASSIVSGVVLYWLQTRRDIHNERLRQRREDIRVARNWEEEGKKGSLRGFDLAGANLSGKDLARADLEDANFQGAKMWGTRLHKANLRRASFRKARIAGVSFSEADMHSADFTGATITEADFSGAVLCRAKLRHAKRITNCNWQFVEIDETTELSPQLMEQIQARQKRP